MDSYHSENDYELLYMIYQMDEGSLQRLLDKYYKYSESQIHYYLYHDEIKLFAEECLAETPALILKAIYAYRLDKKTTFSTFYHQLFHHHMINYRRRYWTYNGQCERNQLSLDTFVNDNNNTLMNTVVNDDITLEGIYILYQEEYKYVIKQLFVNLRPIEQKVIMMYRDGYSYHDIASALHLNHRQVEYILTKVRKSKALID